MTVSSQESDKTRNIKNALSIHRGGNVLPCGGKSLGLSKSIQGSCPYGEMSDTRYKPGVLGHLF